VLQQLSSQPPAKHLNLTVREGLLAAELLHKAAQDARQSKGEPGQVVKKQQSAGLHSFNQWASKHLQDLDAEQHVLILDCMGAMAQAGIGVFTRGWTGAASRRAPWATLGSTLDIVLWVVRGKRCHVYMLNPPAVPCLFYCTGPWLWAPARGQQQLSSLADLWCPCSVTSCCSCKCCGWPAQPVI